MTIGAFAVSVVSLMAGFVGPRRIDCILPIKESPSCTGTSACAAHTREEMMRCNIHSEVKRVGQLIAGKNRCIQYAVSVPRSLYLTIGAKLEREVKTAESYRVFDNRRHKI